eukprot:Plantae.Rhodophyta-Palmaria_palmata.ctg15406.p1 GENE.Plantae.Rhodophyta-Palmaria_palmata.ctg15406~~Plantae.Rhodophyta-Palmaria_palmata.ctg15406.p1  ORF type:complete len:106 (-),score=2.06 Plantae.Rhodophyta-Palmaria_palmata.ctg15406:199-516(-)
MESFTCSSAEDLQSCQRPNDCVGCRPFRLHCYAREVSCAGVRQELQVFVAVYFGLGDWPCCVKRDGIEEGIAGAGHILKVLRHVFPRMKASHDKYPQFPLILRMC